VSDVTDPHAHSDADVHPDARLRNPAAMQDDADDAGDATTEATVSDPHGSADITVIDDADGDPPEPSPGALVLAGLAVPGLNLTEAHHLVTVRATRRLRRQRVALSGVAAIVVVALAVVLWPHPDPQEINADGDRTTTIAPATTAAPVTTVAPVITTIAPTTVAPVTTAKPVVTTVPPTTTTTIPPNQPMTVSAKIVGVDGQPLTTVNVGDAMMVRVNWTDPDLADPSVVDVHTDFRDPLVALAITGTPRTPCASHGGGASAQVDVPFRFSTPTDLGGSSKVVVEVTACDGAGAFGERHTVEVPVSVKAIPDKRAAVLVGLLDGRVPDAADVLAGGTGALLSARRTPELNQVLASDGATRATVATIAANYAGSLIARWSEPIACQRSAQPSEVAAQPETVKVVLDPAPVTCPVQAGSGASVPPVSIRP